jgi:microcystin-dependent protein
MSYFIGEIILFGGIKIPPGFLPCDGREIRVKDNPALYTIILNNYGGTPEKTFCLPDLRGRAPIGLSVSESASHSRHQLGESGGGEKLTSAARHERGNSNPDLRFSGCGHRAACPGQGYA